MPQQYTPTPMNHAQITTPSGGDNRNAASVGLPLSQLADKIEWTRRGSIVAPASIAANQNNYAPSGLGDATVLRLDLSGNYTLNGLDASGAVKLKLLFNVSASNAVTLAHLAGGQTAGNQFHCPSLVNCTLGPHDAAYVFHDATSGYWRVIPAGRRAAYTWDGVHVWNASPMLGSDAEINYFAARPRHTKIPLTHTSATGADPWYWATNFAFLASTGGTGNGAMRIPVRLPTGSIFKGALAGVRNMNSEAVSMYVYKHSHDILGTGLGTRVQLGTTATSTGSGALHIITSGSSFNETVNNTATDYYVEFHAPTTALQELHWLIVSWDDVGLRNL